MYDGEHLYDIGDSFFVNKQLMFAIANQYYKNYYTGSQDSIKDNTPYVVVDFDIQEDGNIWYKADGIAWVPEGCMQVPDKTAIGSIELENVMLF